MVPVGYPPEALQFAGLKVRTGASIRRNAPYQSLSSERFDSSISHLFAVYTHVYVHTNVQIRYYEIGMYCRAKTLAEEWLSEHKFASASEDFRQC